MATTHSVNEYLETVLSTEDAIEALLNGQRIDEAVLGDSTECELFNEHSQQVLHAESIVSMPTESGNKDAYFRNKVDTWFMPDKYKQINIEDYIVNKCKTQFEIDRCMYELNMYEARGLEDVLRFLIYLVDYLRENNIVWGVGRGSSVASYILFLIGIHKINSLKYKLDIKEFLK